MSIKDFAIIDNIEIDFQKGLNILTGETGSGKSIIIEAVSLALGSRADTAFVRSGKNRALIQLSAEDRDGREMVISREVLASGKSTCKINGELVTLSQLSSICKKIADIHGQYDHQSLLNTDLHIELLDAYQAPLISELKKNVENNFRKYESARKELALLHSNRSEAIRKRDFMLYEINEIDAAGVSPGEDDSLSSELIILQNSEKIMENLLFSYESLYASENAALNSISIVMHRLHELSSYGSEFQRIANALEEINYSLEDISSDIRKQKDNTEIDPLRTDEIIARLDLISSLKRKYGGTIIQILDHRDRLAAELEKFEHADERIKSVQAELEIFLSDLAEASEKLSSQRKITAAAIEKKIDRELSDLHFHDASLNIRFTTLTDDGGNPVYTEKGTDKVEFLIKSNKGEVAKPLAKIASGGEISRIMLAFKRIIGDYDEIPTMIFDEIDSGISGVTASVVGRKLSAISRNHQIICITHLPQIAAQGDHNYRIVKKTEGDHTFTVVEALSHEEKILEIARMLAGMDITEHSLKNAEDLVASLKATTT